MELHPSGGVVPVDKAAGPTSHDVVAMARRALGTRRVGHTGTLDPFATGLLLLCVGPATRLSEYLTGLPKRYRACVRVGVSTSTGDLDGEVEATEERWRALTEAEVETALERFRGRILQVPPRFSAKKIRGEAAHYRARRGEEVELAAVEVEVHALDLVRFAPPDIELEVCCSSGTYVRGLARDLGEALGTGAHLTALRRTAVGPFEVATALSVEELEDPRAVERAWLSPSNALAHLPCVRIGAEEARDLSHGRALSLGQREPVAGPVAVLLEADLVAVAEWEGDWLRPRKVFAEAAS